MKFVKLCEIRIFCTVVSKISDFVMEALSKLREFYGFVKYAKIM